MWATMITFSFVCFIFKSRPTRNFFSQISIQIKLMITQNDSSDDGEKYSISFYSVEQCWKAFSKLYFVRFNEPKNY